jgi:hypothetical protein
VPQMTAQEKLIDRAKRSVLYITSVPRNGSGEPIQGTGFIITGTGFVLTAAHIVPPKEERDLWEIKASVGTRNDADKDRYKVEIIKRDSDVDVALLKLPELPGRTWDALSCGDPSTVQDGTELFAVGFPAGYDLTSSSSGPRANVNGSNGRWQVTVPLNRGQSGGPVFVEGRVVGLVAAGVPGLQQVNFVIPLNLAEDLLRIAAASESPAEDVLLDPDKLPCLCDRDDQDNFLGKELGAHVKANKRRPLLIVLNGHLSEGHGYYIDRLEARSILQWLTLLNRPGRRLVVKIPEALDCRESLQEFAQDLRDRFAGRVSIASFEEDNFFLTFARDSRLRALIVVSTVWASEYEEKMRTSVHKICEYLIRFPDLPEGVVIGFVLCLKYGQAQGENRLSRVLDTIFRRSRNGQAYRQPSQQDRALEAELQACREKYREDVRLRFVELPTLTPVTPNDVLRWLDHPDVRPHARVDATLAITTIFGKETQMPMGELHDKLRQLMRSQGKEPK